MPYNPVLPLRCPPELLEDLARAGRSLGAESRSDTARRALDVGLKTLELAAADEAASAPLEGSSE